MKNSNENLMGRIWLLTFLQHQNAIFYDQNIKICNPLLLRRFCGLCVNSATFGKSATFVFILTCHKKPGRNPALVIVLDF